MQTRAALRRAQAAPSLSDAAYMTFGTTELTEYIFEGVPAKDLIRARRTCKRFDAIITSDKALDKHKLKTFLHPSSSPPTDHTIWKHMSNCLETWQPYIGTPEEAQNDFRARPILAINPAFASFEMPPKSESNVYGFENAIIHFDAGAFASAIKAGSCWTKTLLTQPGLPGCSKISLTFPGIASAYEKCIKAKYPRRRFDFVAFMDRHQTVPVYGTGPNMFATLGDVKRAIERTSSLADGGWLKIDDVRMTIEGCVTELSNCVRHARTRERGEVVDRKFNSWR